MTPSEKNIVKSLIAVAWADGKLEDPESDVIDAVLQGFDANEEQSEELRSYAKDERTLEDIPLGELNPEDRELLLGNAAVLTRADGEQADSETKLLGELSKLLGFSDDDAKVIIDASEDGALQLKSTSLRPEPPPAPSRRKS